MICLTGDAMKWLRWLKPDLDKRPQEPNPAPALYDWQADPEACRDFKPWLKFQATAALVHPSAEKPKAPRPVVLPDPSVRDLPTPTAHVIGDRPRAWAEPDEDDGEGSLGSDRCIIYDVNGLTQCALPAMPGKLVCQEHFDEGENGPSPSYL